MQNFCEIRRKDFAAKAASPPLSFILFFSQCGNRVTTNFINQLSEIFRKLFEMPAADNFYNPKKIRIIQQNWACLLEGPDEFQRGIIVGKSMSADKIPMVMVECVDTGDVKLAELKRLYECPRDLLGIPKCGAHILLTAKDGKNTEQ